MLMMYVYIYYEREGMRHFFFFARLFMANTNYYGPICIFSGLHWMDMIHSRALKIVQQYTNKQNNICLMDR